MTAPSSPFHVACPACGAQPRRYCLGEPSRGGPYHQDRIIAWRELCGDASPVVDVTKLRRERDVAVRALLRVARGGDAPGYVARCALSALGVDADAVGAEPARAPLEMDDDLRARLARDSAALLDSTH